MICKYMRSKVVDMLNDNKFYCIIQKMFYFILKILMFEEEVKKNVLILIDNFDFEGKLKMQ